MKKAVILIAAVSATAHAGEIEQFTYTTSLSPGYANIQGTLERPGKFMTASVKCDGDFVGILNGITTGRNFQGVVEIGNRSCSKMTLETVDFKR